MNKIKQVAKHLSLINIQRICAFLIIVLYLYTYKYAFRQMRTYLGDYPGELMFEEYMQYILLTFGSALLFAVLTLVILCSKKHILSSISSIILVYLQRLYLGIPENNLTVLFELEYRDRFFYTEVVNTKARLLEYKGYAEYFYNGKAIRCCERAMEMIDTIVKVQNILILLALLTIVGTIIIKIYKSIKKISVESENIYNKSDNVRILIFRGVNYLLAIGMFEFIWKCAEERTGKICLENIIKLSMNKTTELIYAFKLIGLPILLLLVIIVNNMIKKEWYILVTILYGMLYTALNNSIYLFYEAGIYDAGCDDDLEKFLFYFILVIIIFVMAVIWKYFSKLLIKIWTKVRAIIYEKYIKKLKIGH